jgi:murein DD-endopeptidase MepM/ murein hydrolase activator NlpD
MFSTRIIKGFFAFFAALLVSCNGFKVDRLLTKESPYEKYLHAIESSDIRDYAMVFDWKQEGIEVLKTQLNVDLPYTEVTYFDPKTPKAQLWRYEVEEGSQISIWVNAFSDNITSFFIDVFDVIPGEEYKRIHYAEDSGYVNYEVKSSGIHALRIQPELFRGGALELQINYQGILAFPIPGKTSRNIDSFWGDPRDGDARKHEGIDVFAPRGTPVLAVTDGRISRVGNNRLGGKVVWLLDSKRGYSQYYAHLDSQAVSPGQRISQGDTIGFVGNTGNAITTAPHLHFGIYRTRRGAVNPLPFVLDRRPLEPLARADTAGVGGMGIVAASLANIRTQPGTHSSKLGGFERSTLLQMEGKTHGWYRVSLPDGRKGYIHEGLANRIDEPLGKIEINPQTIIKTAWEEGESLSGNLFTGEARIWGIFENQYFVETPLGLRGWINAD